uniref:CID domain-containing protein n=1 Tax=Anopheles farauti TaxID=69004 RepID=A0A182QI56_9DIPT
MPTVIMEQTKPALDETRAKQIEKEYLSSLADLNVNSKPLINMLTILAEENLEYAPIIVPLLEKHLAKVAPDVKLPILYLVDSIIKNVGKKYLELFSEVIVNMFCGVFQSVNEKIREKMFSLRQTWNDVFEQPKLYTLDVKINSIDPGWPITAHPKIHFNPNFLKGSEAATMNVQQQLRDKHRELLELQAKKLELELIQTKKRIAEQEKQISIQTASVTKEPAVEYMGKLDGGTPHVPMMLGSISTAVPPPGVLPKSRIAPVPQGMINMVKTRDPRLAKQQAAAAQHGGGVGGVPSSATLIPPVMNNHPSLGPMTVPPPVLVPGMLETQNSAATTKPHSVTPVKDRVVGRMRRADAAGGGEGDDGAAVRNKKIPSTTTSSSTSSHKSRHEHDVKPRKERKEHSSSSSSSSNRSSVKGKSSSNSSSRASGSSSTDKRKQRTQSNSDSSPQSQKSSHSPGKKKSPSEKSSSSSSTHHSQTNSSKTTGNRARSEGRTLSDPVATAGGVKNSQHARTFNLLDEIKSNPEGQDVDLRFDVPQKRMKVDETAMTKAEQADEMVVTLVGQKASEVQNNSATDDDEALAAMIAKDIDLRAIPLQLMPPPSKRLAEHEMVPPVDGSDSDLTKESSTKRSEESEQMDEFSGGKKRTSTTKCEEPTAKKSKAEMLDALFGNEDVDLRQLPIGNALLISEDAQEVESAMDLPRSPLSEKTNNNHEESLIRAKHLDSIKSQEKDKLGRPLLYNKLPDDPVERRRSISSLAKPGDFDHRQLPQSAVHHHHDETVDLDDENSMDSMNANIKTIVAQAQDQMAKGEITPDQYNILMKQVIQLNETQKIRQAQRMEQVKRHDQVSLVRYDDNGSLSGDDDVIVTSVTPGTGSHGMRLKDNDFRNKIHPLDGKPPLGPFAGIGVPSTSIPPPEIRAQRDPRRVRESKWNRVEPALGPGPAWANRPNVGSVPIPPLATGIRGAPGMVVPSPWEQAPFPVMPGPNLPMGVLGGPLAPQPPPKGKSMLNPAMGKMNDSVRTINIDGIQREIRFYDETAVIFMNWDEPKEIGFQKGARTVVVDDRETFELGFNEPYKSVSIENKVYQMRLGAPTRELYIDDSWYECYFGDPPTTIMLDGKPRVLKIAGPAPQVKIGASRKDLVAGKINMIVDANFIIPVFLDCKVQSFEVYGQMHRLQFADFLLTVLIDDQPFSVDFGGLPMLVRSRERDYYVRFTALPNQVVPGRVYVRDMIRTPLYRDLRTPPKDPSALPPAVPLNPPFAPPTAGPPVLPPPGIGFGPLNNLPPPAIGGGPPHHHAGIGNQSQTVSKGLDYLTNLMPSMAMQAGGKNGPGYRIEVDEKAAGAGATQQQPSAPSIGGIPLLANINVEELYKKIVAAGIITKQGAENSSSPTPPRTDAGTAPSSKDAKEDASKSKDKDKTPPVPAIEPVLLDKLETLKKRQAAIVYQLFSGMQCSSCGVRFPPEQTMKYSQHLDWHFRQNRRDRDSARKAHSRKWYYDVSDWIQYEEIEDLEEREKNWFETQQTDQGELKKGGIGGGTGGGAGGVGAGNSGTGDGEEFSSNADSPHPSCPAGTDENDRQCHMCHDVFEHFYNEETEEWHLKNAIRVDGSTYHPLCYEDYKASLTMTETTLGDGTLGASLDESHKTDDAMDTTEGNNGAGEGKGDDEQKGDGRKKGEGMEEDDDDDDVIVLPTVEPVVEEILDDEEDRSGGASATKPGDTNGDAAESEKNEEPLATVAKSPRQPEFQERQIDEDLFIQEPNIEVTDLDLIEDKPIDETAQTDGKGDADGENSLSSLLRVKIKEEPKDDDEEADEEDALFEDVGTIESSLLEVDEHSSPPAINNAEEEQIEDVVVESIPSPSESSNQMGVLTQPKASIDGNVELQDAPQSTVVVPNKIRINITKTKTSAMSGQPANSGNHGDGDTGDASNGMNVNNFNEDSQGGAVGPDGCGALDQSDITLDEVSQDGIGCWEEKDELNGSEQSNNKEASTAATTAAAAAAAAAAVIAFEETTDVAYELKDTLKGVDLNRQPRVTSGYEASGLCSIM